MKAMVYTHYGSPDVLRLKDVAKPTPRANEVLINVHAASLNSADGHYLRGAPLVFRLDCGPLKPKNILLGADVAGQVEAVGSDVTWFSQVMRFSETCPRVTGARLPSMSVLARMPWR